jgi:hypothetical protein
MFNKKITVQDQLNDNHLALIIGCGEKNLHSHKYAHPSNKFYTVDIDRETYPSLVGSILEPNVIEYLKQRKFKLICIESVPALFFVSDDQIKGLIDNMFKLLDKEGKFVILSCGNLNEFNPLYNALFEHIEQFEIYKAYTTLAPDFPMCTIIASQSNAYLESDAAYPNECKEFIDKAIKGKHNDHRDFIKMEIDKIVKDDISSVYRVCSVTPKKV